MTPTHVVRVRSSVRIMMIGPAMHPHPGSESDVATNTPGDPSPSPSRTAVR